MSSPFFKRPLPSREPKHRRNGKIRAREVRVLDEQKKQLGVMPLNDALRLAQAQGLDLVEIVPHAEPPVCRIVNYGKLLYEEAKHEKDARSTGSQMKEIQLRATIDAHDLQTKVNRAREFLTEGAIVKVALRFRGREMRHPELGMQVVEKFLAELAGVGLTDGAPKRAERTIQIMVRPVAKQQRAKAPAKPDQPASQVPPPPVVAPAEASPLQT